eukprot:COSAG01_NODE_890_length_12913_cov_10.881302_4_plen_45_part_00
MLIARILEEAVAAGCTGGAGWQAGWLAAGWLLPAGSRNQPQLNG